MRMLRDHDEKVAAAADVNPIRKTPQNTDLNEGGATQEGDIQAAETAAATIPAGDAFEEVCFTGGFNGSDAFDTGIIAIRIKASL
jgi:hypothetical protein